MSIEPIAYAAAVLGLHAVAMHLDAEDRERGYAVQMCHRALGTKPVYVNDILTCQSRQKSESNP